MNFQISNSPMRKSFFRSFLKRFGITGFLIGVNVIVFILVILLSFFIDTTRYFALQPNNLFFNGYIWTLLTSMFMHAGMFHLFVNMLSLFFIGRFLEMLIGKKRFFWVYIFSGLFAGLFFAVLAFFFGESSIGARIFSSPETSAVGASGAIFAIAGVLALITPKSKVYLIAGPLIALIIEAFIQNISIFKSFIGIIDILIYVYIFFCIFSMFSFNPSGNKIALPLQISFWALPLVAIVPLIIVGLFVELPIGNMAHLGGFLFGILYGVYLRIKYKKKVQIISNYFSR